MLRTKLTELLGIDLPIMLAGMGGVSYADLVAAVSEAGGFGVLGAHNLTPDELRSEIRKVRSLTAKPFGVDLLLPQGLPTDDRQLTIPPLPPFLDELIDSVKGYPKPKSTPILTAEVAREQFNVAVDERVALIVPALGIPDWVVAEAHRHGIKVAAIVGAVRNAVQAAQRGADFIIAQGAEAGGHVGQVGSMVLIPAVVDAVDVPVVAAGGIADGRGIAAALVMGAQGVWLGTRFIATTEATAVPGSIKDRMLRMTDQDTIVSRCYTGKPNRLLRNRFTDMWNGNEQYLQPMPVQIEMVAPVVGPAREAGDPDLGVWPTGQGACLIKEVKSAGALTRDLAAEAERLLSGVRL
jgi:NAD(P)H-dependent flavin oxidoreductase YrpB (nitropropane dioxygenase family)